MPGILQDIGGFAERNAPTILSTLGGIGGEAIDPFGGGIAGAALGGSLGQGVKNHYEGQDPLQSNDLTSGIESGVGQGIGYGALAGAGKVLGAVGKTVAPKIAESGISDVLSKVTPAALKRLGNSVGINPTLETATKLGITDSADPTQLTTDDLEKMSSSGLPNVATGADGILSATRDAIANKALDDSGRSIDLDQVRNMANDTAEKHGLNSDLTTNGAGGLPKQQGAGANAANYAMGVIRKGSTTAEGAQNLLKEADTLPSTNPLKGYYNEVAKNVQDQIYNAPEVKQALSDYKTTPEDRQAFLQATGGNQKFADYIGDTLDNANSNSDIAKAHSDLINVRALGDAGKSVANNTVQKAGGTPGNNVALEAAGHLVTGNPLKAAATLGKKALTSPEGAAKVSKVASAGGDILNRMAKLAKFTGPATAGTFAGALGSVGQPGMQNTANVTPTGANMTPQAGAQQPMNPLQAIQTLALLDPTQYSSMANTILPQIQKTAAAAPLVSGAQQAATQPGVSGNPIDAILAKIPGTPQWQAAQAALRAASALGTSSTYSPMAAPTQNQAGLSALSQIPGATGY